VDLIADTTFLVGLWRRQEWAMTFAENHPDQVLGIPWVVRAEFWHGAMRAGHDTKEVERFLSLGLALDDPAPVIPIYARIAATLQAEHRGVYQAIGQNDLWIAAVVVHAELPLLTRNQRHFDSIDGLVLHVLKI